MANKYTFTAHGTPNMQAFLDAWAEILGNRFNVDLKFTITGKKGEQERHKELETEVTTPT